MNTTWSIRPERVPPRAAFDQLMRTEWVTMLRSRTGLIAGLGLPLLLLVLFGSLPTFSQPDSSLGGLSTIDVYLPIFVVMAVTIIGLISLPPTLVSYRELGILRRLSTTPLPRSWVLGAQLILNFCLAVVALLLMFVIGTTVYGLHWPDNPGGFLIAAVLTILSLFMLGLCVSAIARTSRASLIMGAALFYLMLFFAGIWYPQQLMAPVLRDVCQSMPAGASVQALTSAMQGAFPPAVPLLAMVGWTIVFGFLAVRTFKWE
jgi:ABC-2 type transport system permease protein